MKQVAIIVLAIAIAIAVYIMLFNASYARGETVFQPKFWASLSGQKALDRN